MDDTEPDYPEYTFKRVLPPCPLFFICCAVCDHVFAEHAVVYARRVEEDYETYCDECIEDYTDEEGFTIIQ